jgi:gas vesicle protein
MLSARFLLGAVIGGSLVYFFDPKSGAERRARLQGRWEENREPIMSTASKAASTAQESATQLSGQATARVTELKSKVQRQQGGAGAQYDTESAGTSGAREDTRTQDLPERMRTYEAQPEASTEGGDLPAPR